MFDAIEELRKKNTNKLNNLSSSDIDFIFKLINESEYKNEIISKNFDYLYNCHKTNLFDLIYNMEEYQILVLKYIQEYGFIIDTNKIVNILNDSSSGLDFVVDNIDVFAKTNDYILISDIIKVAIKKERKDILKKLSLCSNLHLRSIFMEKLLVDYKELVNEIYDDISKYLTNETGINNQLTMEPIIMEEHDICDVIEAYLENFNDLKVYNNMKEILLDKYSKNSLAKILLDGQYRVDIDKKIELFKEDADRLFLSSKTYQMFILENYSNYIKEELLQKLRELKEKFKNNPDALGRMYYDGLGPTLEELIEKYMDLSKNKEFKYLDKGSTAVCYKMGDYVIKLINRKYSKEDIICPRMYLVLKNEEEIYLRSNKAVVGGIEIQKYLQREVGNINPDLLTLYQEELNELGYYCIDALVNGQCGDNIRYLDSYMDADTICPEKLPNWFKKDPIVLIDHDHVYKNSISKSSHYLKKIRSNWLD